MRTLFFNLFFYMTTIIYILSCLIFSLIPGRAALMGALRRYTKVMVWGPKHQSYGDGFVVFSQFKDLSFVTGDHLEKYWGLKRILTKMNAVVIDNCGGSDSQEKMEKQAEVVRDPCRQYAGTTVESK